MPLRCFRPLPLLLAFAVALSTASATRQSHQTFAVGSDWQWGVLITAPYRSSEQPPPLRGILFWGNGAGFDERARAYDLELVELAEQIDFALMATSQWGNLSDPVQVATLERAFDYLADATTQPELARAPILPLGMSNGGQMSYGINALWPERTIAFAANKGGFYNNPTPPAAALLTPGLLVTGGADEAYRHDAILALFHTNRPRGARWAWAEEEGIGHAIADSMELILPFAAEMAQLRYPADTPFPADAPAPLINLPESSGWMVARDEHLGGLAHVVPYADYTGDRSLASWLPTRRSAFIYRAFASHAKASPTAVLTPDWPTVQRGTSLTYTIAPTDSTWSRIEYFEGDTLLRTVVPGDDDPFAVSLSPEASGYVVLHALVTFADGHQRTTMPRRKLVARSHRYGDPSNRDLWGEFDLDIGSPLDLTGLMFGLGGTPPPDLTWLRNGEILPHQDTAHLTLPAVTADDAGIYQLVASRDLFQSFSEPLHVYVSDPVAPQLGDITVSVHPTLGGHASLTLDVPSGQPPLTFQWSLNGEDIPGATSSSLELPLLQFWHAGTYTVTARLRQSPATATATITLPDPPAATGRLLNLSVRGFSGAGEEAMVAGFVTTDAAKSIIVRAIGPSLTAFGVTQALPDPQLTLRRSQGEALPLLIADNDQWSDSTAETAVLHDAFARVGAFPLADDAPEAALLQTLAPGAYTATAADSSGATGIALVEVYDADDSASSNPGRLRNLSSRGVVNWSTRTLSAGFVVGGDGPVDLLIRAVGPGLAAYGVNQVSANPRFTLYRHVDGTSIPLLTVEDNFAYQKSARLATAAEVVGAFSLPPNSLDAADIVRLQPGAYSVIVTGPYIYPGVALLELYEIP